MITCQECDAANDLKSIFCRTCGKRLNLENVRPEHFGIDAEVYDYEEERSSGMKQTIRMLAVGAVLFCAPLFKSDFMKSLTADNLSGVVSFVVLIELVLEVVRTRSMERSLPWLVALLALATVQKANWPAAASLGVIIVAWIIAGALKGGRGRHAAEQ